MMTKQHYQLIADAINATTNDGARMMSLNRFIVELSRRLREDNPRFDEDRFRAAIKR